MARRHGGYDYDTVPGGYDPQGPRGPGRFRQRLAALRSPRIGEARDFFTALFDFRFDVPVATRLIRGLYAVIIALAALWALGIVIGGFSSGVVSGLIALLIVAPLVFVALTAGGRIALELVVVLFRIGDDLREIRNRPRR